MGSVPGEGTIGRIQATAHKSYFTSLRWPWEIDTINIDVLAYNGDDPFSASVGRPTNAAGALSLWPNSAPTQLRIPNLGDAATIGYILDIL